MISVTPKTRKVEGSYAVKYRKAYRGGVSHKVPCGKCAYCLVNKRSSWMFRVHHEMRKQMHKGYFLTLTYDEKHVKRVPGGGLSLRFRDVQLYLKQLRKAKYYAKYICVGEYGAETKRPHYHMLLWTDCPVEKLEAIWRRGRIHFGTLSMASAMYTLKYIIQPKQKAVDGLEPTRAQFSKGIGIGYLSESVYYWHNQDEDAPQVFSYIDGQKVALPRYYKSKIFTKYQLRIAAAEVQKQSQEKWRDTERMLSSQGVGNVKQYIFDRRVEECERIIKKTKYNLSL